MQIFDVYRAGNYVTNGNVQNKDNSKEVDSWLKYDENGDGTINFAEFVSFKNDNSKVNTSIKEHTQTNKYEQMLKELEAVEKAIGEEIDRPLPQYNGIF